MAKTYSMAETAQAFGLPASTLRYYDKEGLLPGVVRTEGGMRRFTAETMSALHIISCLKISGLSIQEIREFFSIPDDDQQAVSERLRIFESRRQAVQKQMAELQETLDVLDYKCWYYETAEALGSLTAMADLPAAQIPPRLREVKERIEQLPQSSET